MSPQTHSYLHVSVLHAWVFCPMGVNVLICKTGAIVSTSLVKGKW